jgi:hypothetical protein
MSIVAVSLFLTALVVLLLKTGQVGVGGAAVCVILGLVLGGTPAGPAISDALNESGSWAWAQVESL